MNNPIGWGKCTVVVKDLDEDGAEWVVLPTPKESTTTLTVTKGDKKEASIEGGGNEDVKYLKNTYELAYSIRRNTSRKRFFDDTDGVISHRYAVFVQPENIKVPGPYMEKSVVSLEDSFDTEDGGMWTYTHDGIIPDDNSNTVKWVTTETDLSTYEEGDTISTLSFTNMDE